MPKTQLRKVTTYAQCVPIVLDTIQLVFEQIKILDCFKQFAYEFQGEILLLLI